MSPGRGPGPDPDVPKSDPTALAVAASVTLISGVLFALRPAEPQPRAPPAEPAVARLVEWAWTRWSRTSGRLSSGTAPVLDADPDNLKNFEAIEKIVTPKRDWKALERAYLRMVKRLPDTGKEMTTTVNLQVGG